MLVMDRRTAMFGLAAFFAAGSRALAGNQFPNGEIDRASNTFMWTNIGGDPLRVTWKQALSRTEVVEIVPGHVADELIARLETARHTLKPYQVKEGDRSDYMFSGDGWIAHNAVAVTSRWRRSASRDYWQVYYTDPATGVQYILKFYLECGNLGLTVVGAAKTCRCVPEKGDACSKQK